MGSYIPIPVFIYDKSLLCVFEYYSENESQRKPSLSNHFMMSATAWNSLPDYRGLDFGPVAEGYSHIRYFSLINKNPLTIFTEKIRIGETKCDGELITSKVALIPMKAVDIMSGNTKRNFSNENLQYNKIYDPEEINDNEGNVLFVSESNDLMIPPNSIVIFKVFVQSFILEPDSSCNKFVSSLHFTNFQATDFEIPISFEVIKGDITLFPTDMVRFPPAIPGIVQTKEIIARSNLKKRAFIKSVTSSNPNKVVARIISDTLEPKINKEIIEISTVPFDQSDTFFKMKNNAIFTHLTNIASHPSMVPGENTSTIEPKITYLDILAWQVNEKDWDNKQSLRGTDMTSTITIETNMIQNLTIPVRTVITKPSLLNQEIYDFGKVEVDTEKVSEIIIHNPSPNPIEVSFFIAPSNFLQTIIDELLKDEKLIKWKLLWDKATFFNPYGRKMWEGLIELHSLSETRKKNVVDYFIRNYFNFITNSEVKEHMLLRFISDQKNFLQQTVKNISDVTNAVKPPTKEDIFKKADSFLDYNSVFSKVNHPINPLVILHLAAKRSSQVRAIWWNFWVFKGET